jgi:hypothetical protein
VGIFSKQLTFSDDQAVTATAASTNVIDTGEPGTVVGSDTALTRDIGPGSQVPLLVQVTEDFATLTSLTVSLETDDAEGFGTVETLATSPAIPVASLKAGYKFVFRHIPPGAKRYLRLKYTVAGSSATAGKITAGVVHGHDDGHQV